MFIAKLLLTLSILINLNANAEDIAINDTTETRNESSWWGRRLDELVSPVSTNARYVFVGGSMISLALFLQQHSTGVDFFQSEYGQDKPQGSLSKIGDLAGQLIPNTLYAASFLTHYWISHNDTSWHRTEYMFKATLYPALMSTLLKASLDEKRPSGGRHSFPSGHTTTAFAFATAVACEHAWYWGVPAYALAAFVGLSRMNDSKHYLHDVIAGATLGSSYALGLYLIDKKTKARNVAFYPVTTPSLMGIGLASSFY